MRMLRRRVAAITIISTLLVPIGGPSPAAAAAAVAKPPGRPFTPTPMAPVPGHDFTPAPAKASDPTAGTVAKAPPAVRWPAASDTSVRLTGLSPASIAGAPVRIARAGTTGAGTTPANAAGSTGTARIGVRVFDRATTGRAHVDGLLLRVSGDTADPLHVSVDYSSFQRAYGGDWAGRLRLVRLPECALTTPTAVACAAVPVASVNDRHARSVSATLAGGGLLALVAGDSSDNGDFKATSFAPSSAWTAGGSSGDFAWGYQMRVPPGLGGPAPSVALGYSAQSVDGQTAAINSQPSWIGEGFDYSPGYIERSYNSCSDDGQGTTIGDECWAGDNATLSMTGRGGALVRDDATGTWHSRNDDGSRVQKITTTNADNDGEAWLLTTQDGTRYYFGLGALPGAPAGTDTGSTWTTTVFGDDAGEPCHQSTFAASYCNQAYRWNLDYVVDPQGNTMSLWYDTQTNNYSRNHTDGTVSTYVRAGTINHIEYGTHQDPVTGYDSRFSVSAPMRVDFTVTDRCITPGATCNSGNPSNWPDVPWDRQCTSTTNCAGRYSPTYWTTKHLASVVTRVWGGSAYRDVEQWTLTTEFRDPGDGNQAILWLRSLGHSGLTPGYPAASPIPDITFGAVAMTNRVDVNSSTNPIWRLRISSITSESGGVTSVAYSPAECQIGGVMPGAPESNTKRCYPVYWIKPGTTTPALEYFHRYVVVSVTDSDPVGGGVPVTTSYTYLDTPAWHFDDNPFTPVARRTYSQWRGYSQVRTIVGQAGTTQTQTDSLYFRGMNGDKLPSGVRTVNVVDSMGGSVPDNPWNAGAQREQVNFNGISPAGSGYGTGAPYIFKTLYDNWSYGPTASQNLGGVAMASYVSGIATETTYKAVTGGPDRVSRVTTTFDGPTGRVLSVDDQGDLSTTADDRCRRNEYAENAAKGMYAYIARIETVSVNCASPVNRPSQVLSDVRSWFDGATSFDKQVSTGKVTKTEQMTSYSGGQPVYAQASRNTYDSYGRTIETYDSLDHRSTMAYTPATGGPVTSITATNVMGWPTTTTVEPAWGSILRATDQNGRVTDFQYDTLGRMVSGWAPGRSKATQTPTVTYTYLMQNNAVSSIATAALNTAGTGYITSYTLYDGLLRERQTQRPSATGTGRVLRDTIYDYRGLVWKTNTDYYTTGTPAGTLFVVADASVPAQQQALYDNAQRVTDSILKSYNVEKWRTTTSYGGDRVNVTPPAGQTPTTSIFDARDQLTELRQYLGATPTGAFDATRYTYTPAGSIATVTDAAGTVWSYAYDQLGRKITVNDPDAGTSRLTYDAAGRIASTTDARGITVSTAYDNLGRRLSTWQGAVGTGTKLTEYTYDTIALGQPTSSTRWSGGNAYTKTVTGYDPEYRPTGASVTIPAAEGAIAGTYPSALTYNPDGTTATSSFPAAGGLPAETLTYGYNSVGLSATLSGLSSYLVGTAYDPLGRPVEAQVSDGAKTLAKDYVYDTATGRLTRHLIWGDTTPLVLADDNYTYDPAGNITAISDKLAQYGAGSDDNQCFKHDYLRRLTQAWTPSSGNCATAPSTAGLGGPAPYWLDYTYDVASNRRTETSHTVAATTTHTYTYPGATAAQPHTLSSVTGSDGTAAYQYDAAGNTTGRVLPTGTQSLTWDAEEHLSTVTQGVAQTSYVYDADGNQLIRHDPSGTTAYIDGQEVHATPAGVLSATRYYSDVAVRSTTTGLTWLGDDHQGTSSISVHAGDMAVTVRRQTPFGGSRGAAPASWPSERGFVGGTKQPSTGLVNVGARQYDSTTGRFISADPVNNSTDPQQLQGYAYADNSPVTSSDPSGQMLHALDGGGSSAGAPSSDGDQRPEGVFKREGMGKNKNVYMAAVKMADGSTVFVYEKITDACDYSHGPATCGANTSRLFNVEILGVAGTCTSADGSVSPCYLGADKAVHNIDGTQCFGASGFTNNCPAGGPPNLVITMRVDLTATSRCSNTKAPPQTYNLEPNNNPQPAPPSEPVDNRDCTHRDPTQCHLGNAIKTLDEWLSWVPGVGSITSGLSVAVDVGDRDYNEAAKDSFTWLADATLRDPLVEAGGEAVKNAVMKYGQSQFAADVLSKSTNPLTYYGAQAICAYAPANADMGVVGLCLI